MLERAGRILNITNDENGIDFNDTKNIASWAKKAISYVSGSEDRTTVLKVMGGIGDNKFGPSQTYTKQQAFVTVKRLYYSDK